jgi:hypothetical protein
MLGADMSIRARILTFLLSGIALGVIYAMLRVGLPENDPTAVTLIFSSLLTLSFVILLVEHWFTKPADVVATCISLLLALAPSKSGLSKLGVWYNAFFGYVLVILVIALFALSLLDKDRNSDSPRNIWSNRLKNISTKFGSSKILYFSCFLLCSIFYVNSQSAIFLALVIYSGVIITIDPKTLFTTFNFSKKAPQNDIGEIIGVQSRHTYLARLISGRPRVRRYDFVEFLEDASGSPSRKGIIIDNWVLNSDQWVKIISGSDINTALGSSISTENMKPKTVYLIENEDTTGILARFVGTLAEGSSILNIRFEYGMKVPIQEGTLIELTVRDAKVLYQVTQGLTEVEILEQKNEAGSIVGFASQIGTWNNQTLTFDRFGWVPEMNTPVYSASNIEHIATPNDEILIGHIPDTNYPIFMNKLTAINCHMAILGVTGTGKSVFSRNIIRQLSPDMKFICVDFTGEYAGKIADLNPVDIVPDQVATQLFQNIDAIELEMAKFANQRNVNLLAQWEQEIRAGFSQSINDFFAAADRVAIFELPDVANSTAILNYTRWFFKVLFEIARQPGQALGQLCVVLEEAHTVIPEWGFVSAQDKGAQALLNQIAQIALQGRKYGVGFMVIAQRTANVSKTVLTQCNTVIAFQQFDKTSGDFLANYMGTSMIDALQNLKPRQAIAVGKAFRSGLPVIFNVPEIAEP